MDQNQPPYFTPTPFQPKPKKAAWPWVLLALFVFFVIFVIVIMIVAGSDNGKTNTEYTPSGKYAAVLHIEGTIAASSDGTYSQTYLTEKLTSLIADRENVALLLYIDSPGGELYAVDEIYQLLLDYKASGRPIYAYCATYAASGGYYLASVAKEIGANRMSTVGSIGVTYGYHMDLTGLCTKLGVNVTALASADNKSMGGYFSPLTEEQEAIYQSQIDEYYNVFVDVVADGRTELSREQIIALADGRTYTATQAKSNGLIDEVSNYDDFLVGMKAVENLSCEFVDYAYSYTGISVTDLLDLLGTASGDPASLTSEELTALVTRLAAFRGPMVLYRLN